MNLSFIPFIIFSVTCECFGAFSNELVFGGNCSLIKYTLCCYFSCKQNKTQKEKQSSKREQKVNKHIVRLQVFHFVIITTEKRIISFNNKIILILVLRIERERVEKSGCKRNECGGIELRIVLNGRISFFCSNPFRLERLNKPFLIVSRTHKTR